VRIHRFAHVSAVSGVLHRRPAAKARSDGKAEQPSLLLLPHRRTIIALKAVHGSPWEFYGLEADRTELNNLGRKHSEKVSELKALYEDWATGCGV